MDLFSLCTLCLGLALTSKIPHNPQQNPMHCSFVPTLKIQESQLHKSKWLLLSTQEKFN
ncbi:hypothetical protein ES332_D04G135900v1 [Gossypium tomentosum]|uniref:Uncharacterized protein n=1 Tax=Gossypium tomentosum TaxID=34277 RepID=A0A5D2LE31_GOSTO|nr:hypothetical protein ES332_D04G135900v1 [Gossypium tomentosum]